MTGARILLVEDEDLIRTAVAEVLEEEGFVVTEAESGNAALEILRRVDGFDLLLTDIHMPGSIDGIRLAEETRSMHPGLPVVFVTGRPDVTAAVPSGAATAFLRKPYSLQEVVVTLRSLLRAETDDPR